MHRLQTLDLELFRLLNVKLSNPLFDAVMPFVSGSEAARCIFFPLALIAGVWLVCKGGARGRLCVLALVLAVALSDGFVCNTIKHAIARERPCLVVADAHCLIGKTRSGSMPSSHAANWCAAALVLFVYYRRSLWFMLPGAAAVGFSRVYNGVHYPSDVAVGALVGAGSAAAMLWLLDAFWNWAGPTWFPLWWERLPSFLAPVPREAPAEADEEPIFAPRPSPPPTQHATRTTRHASLDTHWLRLGYVCIAAFLLARLAYLASGTIELTEDEAYQWLWSKHLALSYFSKPPLIAYAQFLSTALWGDNAFGVRFFSPLITALASLLVLRFFAREVNARAGFVLLMVATATPLLALGAILMTVDPLSVLFWILAALAGWRAIQDKGTTRDWLLVGLWMGLGFLSKYTGLIQLLSWTTVFVLWRPARRHLGRPGPYLALLVNALCALPVLIWNYQRGWVSAQHVADDAGAGSAWTRTYVGEFLGLECGLLNPVFFIATAWAAVAFWRRNRHDPRLVYFFSMGAPPFLVYFLWSFRSRILPNWIAPAIMPLLCLMVIYWDVRWRMGAKRIKTWLAVGLVMGLAMVLAAHDTDVWKATLPARRVLADWLAPSRPKLAENLSSPYLPVNWDPLHRVRVWSDVAKAVETARLELEKEGKPAFIIADHYGITGLISFYLPDARARVSGTPLVYFKSTEHAENQFYFWPGYDQLKGQNAIFVRELNRDKPDPKPPPENVRSQFESVAELGITNVPYHGKVCRPLDLFVCRGLK